MKLPWVPLYLDAYIGDTMHLTTEQHGAYFLMMLAYYKSERALPASDDALAAITRLSEDRWRQIRPTMALFFQEKDGLWHHKRMDEEIAERCAKHAKSIANAKSGAAARWGGKAKISADSASEPSNNAEPMLPALPRAIPSSNAHLTLNKESSLSAREREVDVVQVEDAQAPPVPAPSIGYPVPPEFRPMGDWIAEVVEDGFAKDEVSEQTKSFIAHHQERGTFSNNWDASWVKWWMRYVAYKAKNAPKPKAPPRIEVNNAPTEKQYRDGMKKFADGMAWMRRLLGPEPGQSGCLVPREIIIEFGFDPETGLKVRT